MVNNLTAKAGDIRGAGSIPCLSRSPWRRALYIYLYIYTQTSYIYNPLQYSCLENPMDRGAWQATVLEVSRSWTQVSYLACMHAGFMLNVKSYKHLVFVQCIVFLNDNIVLITHSIS